MELETGITFLLCRYLSMYVYMMHTFVCYKKLNILISAAKSENKKISAIIAKYSYVCKIWEKTGNGNG